MFVGGRYPQLVVFKEMFTGIDSFPLMAVPFFILAAELMSGGALTAVLLRFAAQFVGHLRGGLGYANVLSLTLFSGISGSALADAAGPGSMMVKMMDKAGYSRAYAAALTSSTAIVGPIIPPSISMIIYAMQDEQVSVGGLFMAGFLPGLLIALAMAFVNWRVCTKRGYRSTQPRPSGREMLVNSINMLVIVTEVDRLDNLDLTQIMGQLKQRAEQHEPRILGRHGFRDPADFFKHYLRLSVVAVRPMQPDRGTVVWVNTEARHPLPNAVRTILQK